MARSRTFLPSSIKKLLKNRSALVLIVVLAVILAYGGFRVYEVQADKRKFEQARQSINELYSEIVSKAGKPDVTEKNQSCGYASRKFTQGPLSCSVSIQFAYSVVNNVIATSKAIDINSVVIKNNSDNFKLAYSNYKDVIPFTTPTERRKTQELALSLEDNESSKVCTLRLVYGERKNINHFISVTGFKDLLSAVISCGGPAKAEYYPVTN